jgi:membrane protein YdbS with pleckstrin-like domain
MHKIRRVEPWSRLLVVSVIGGAASIAGGYVLGALQASEGWVLAFLVAMILVAGLFTVPHYMRRRAED